MNNVEIIKAKISEVISQYADRKLIIYPFGRYGRIVKRILNDDFGIREFCIIDNNPGTDTEVWKLDAIEADKLNDYLFLVACESAGTYTEIIKTLDSKVRDENIVDIFSDLHCHFYGEPDYIIYDAHRKGLTLGEWHERIRMNETGKSHMVVTAIANSVNFSGGEKSFCEIGPGTGKYTEKLIQKFRPAKYEFYEISDGLKKYLSENLNSSTTAVIAQESDGKNLKNTEDESQDLVFASSVWPILKYSAIYHYFLEMIRVCKNGGYVIFDAIQKILTVKEC